VDVTLVGYKLLHSGDRSALQLLAEQKTLLFTGNSPCNTALSETTLTAVDYFRYIQGSTEEIIFGRDMSNVCFFGRIYGPIQDKGHRASEAEWRNL
jgi:pectin methylesterase-like acyl-CoA thioesterase